MRKGHTVNRHNYQLLQNDLARAIVICREVRLSLSELLCTALKRRAREARFCGVMRSWLAQDEDQMRAYLTGPYSSVYGDELPELWSDLLVTGWLDSIKQAFKPRLIPQDDMVAALRPILHSRTRSLQMPVFRATSPKVLYAIQSLKTYVLSDMLKSQLTSAVSELKSDVWHDVWPSGLRFVQALHAIEAKLEFWSQQSRSELAARYKNTTENKEKDRFERDDFELDDDLSEFDLWLEGSDDPSDNLMLPVWMMLYAADASAQENQEVMRDTPSFMQEPEYYVPTSEAAVFPRAQAEAQDARADTQPSAADDEQWSRRSDGDVASHAVADNGVAHSNLGSFS